MINIIYNTQNLTAGYEVKKAKFLTSDKKDGPWDEIKLGDPRKKIDLDKNNKQFIKVEFSEIGMGYVCIDELRVYQPEADKPPAGLEEQEEQELNENSTDITGSLFISTVATRGTYQGYPVSNAYKNDQSYWCSTVSGDQWIVFDLERCSIDQMEVLQQPGYSTKSIAVYTAQEFDIFKKKNTKWEELASATGIIPGKASTLKLDFKNKRYIKLLLKETPSYGSLQRLKWFGKISGDDDISRDCKIFNVSSSKAGAEPDFLLTDGNSQYWSPKTVDNEYLTFDCQGKEIETIYMQFTPKKKPNGIDIVMAEISNDYAFKQVIKSFSFTDPQKSVEILDIKSLNAYADGYKEFVQLRMTGGSMGATNEITIEQLKFLGKQTTDDNFEADEKVDTIIDSSVETTARGKVICIADSGTYAGAMFSIEQMFIDNYSYWCSSSVSKQAWFIFDCGRYTVDKISIKVNQGYSCGRCVIYTTEKKAGKKSGAWKQIAGITGLDIGLGAKKTSLDGKAQRYIKIVCGFCL